ncbi:MAG: sigma-70 family RNA polymerase sigma factor [Pirellulaceae bacterium]|nr:sigma-70 family RNA polymerase sigma factor [Pirellulaceae bacterium]
MELSIPAPSTVPDETSSSIRPEEAELVARLQAGDDAAFETLVRQYGGRLLAVARQIVGNETDAHDALQDGLITALRAIDRFEGRSKLSTWLHRVVVNASLMRLRSRRRIRETSLDELLPKFLADGHQAAPTPSWSDSALALIEQEETRAAVRAAIDRLPDDYRSVLVLRDLQELDTATVAEMLAITPANVKVRLHRARQALKTLLERLLGSPERAARRDQP